MLNLREIARDKVCMVRVPGVCNRDPKTTVLAHRNGAGMAIKHNDLIAAWCCSACHDYVDGRSYPQARSEIRDLYLADGIHRTQTMLLEMGLIEVKVLQP